MRRRMRKLSSQIFAAQMVILTVTTVIGFALFAFAQRSHLDGEYEARAASIGEAVARIPAIRSCMQTPTSECASEIQSIASTVADGTGASYVVVIGMDQVRFSHPDPALIGQKVTEPIVTSDGRVHRTIDNGSTGRSANGKVPLYGPSGRMVGEVSVGILESSVSAALRRELPSYGVWFAAALAFGALASWGLATLLKRRTFGLELDEIAQLLQEREAILHGIREGLISFDDHDRVTMINDEAKRLLVLPESPVGRRLDEVLPAGRLADVLSGRGSKQDDTVFTDDFCLVINRMPVSFAGHGRGAVVTLRDRTEMAGLLRELDGERGLTESLRSQQHEFSNRMHAVAGLLELGRTDEALCYVTEIRGTAAELDNTLRTQVASPQIVGLLLGKAAAASERGVDLVITPETWLSESPQRIQALTTIIGNLVDNAFDALAAQPAPRRVVVGIIEDDDYVTIDVSDNGPGIPAGVGDLIFRDGWTTKPARSGLRGGLGLALVHRLVVRLEGDIEVSDGPGARFVVRLPRTVVVRPVAAPRV